MPEFAIFLQLNDGLRIGGILVDGDSAWVHRVWLGQRLAEEPLRRPSIALRREQEVDRLAAAVHRPV